MRLRYAVSFENETQSVRTGRGEMEVPNPRLGVRRALEAAQKQCPNAHWRSVVVVLERVEPAVASATDGRAEARRDADARRPCGDP